MRFLKLLIGLWKSGQRLRCFKQSRCVGPQNSRPVNVDDRGHVSSPASHESQWKLLACGLVFSGAEAAKLAGKVGLHLHACTPVSIYNRLGSVAHVTTRLLWSRRKSLHAAEERLSAVAFSRPRILENNATEIMTFTNGSLCQDLTNLEKSSFLFQNRTQNVKLSYILYSFNRETFNYFTDLYSYWQILEYFEVFFLFFEL